MRGNRRATHTNVARGHADTGIRDLLTSHPHECRALDRTQSPRATRQGPPTAFPPRTQGSFVSQPRAHPDRTPIPPRTQRSFSLGDDVVINTALFSTHSISMKRRKRVETRGDSTSSLHTLSKASRLCSSLTRTGPGQHLQRRSPDEMKSRAPSREHHRNPWEWAAEKKRESTDLHLKGRKEIAPKKRRVRNEAESALNEE